MINFKLMRTKKQEEEPRKKSRQAVRTVLCTGTQNLGSTRVPVPEFLPRYSLQVVPHCK